ncbi:MAG: hypothetical protein K0Q66_580 [Chitinophagaceae bacterium]|nr:hypothetical protein [Chitinophagaceae bacterium]
MYKHGGEESEFRTVPTISKTQNDVGLRPQFEL